MPLAANLTGQLMTEAPTARYWRDHLRNAVQFAAGMARVAEAQPAIIIEIGPTASLLGMGRRCEPDLEAAWLPSLREGQDDWQVDRRQRGRVLRPRRADRLARLGSAVAAAHGCCCPIIRSSGRDIGSSSIRRGGG